MSESKSKAVILTRPSPNMTVRRKNDHQDCKDFPEATINSPEKGSPWPAAELMSSSSLDGNSRATSSSWPEEIEETATRKVLNSWYAIERTLYKEDDEVPLGELLEECIQWRTQIPHFRVVGKSMTLKIAENDSDTASISVRPKSNTSVDKQTDDASIENSSQQKKLRGEVIQRVLQFIYAELEKHDVSDEYPASFNRDLDEVLTITPAPSYSGRRLANRKKLNNPPSRKSSSANKFESFQLTELKLNTASSKSQKIDPSIDDSTIDDDETDRLKSTVLGRNKLGTVFNDKIVVSPVPYAVTTRESFCTLKTTPIRYAGHLLELAPQGPNRNMKSASKMNSVYRTSLPRASQRHSAWQTSVCPAVWPKNVRLAPIDPARLPSSKNRSSVVSNSVPQRNRNSLSPISRPLKSTSADPLNGENYLGIQGKPIVTRSAKPNFLKTGWDYKNKMSVRQKSRSKSDR